MSIHFIDLVEPVNSNISQIDNSLISEKSKAVTSLSPTPTCVVNDVKLNPNASSSPKALISREGSPSSNFKNSSEVKNDKSADDNFNLKEPSLDVKMLSPSSEGSLSKYVTPVGSMGDLTIPFDKSLNCNADKNKNEDSGVDSQSLSISHSNATQIQCEHIGESSFKRLVAAIAHSEGRVKSILIFQIVPS